MPKNSAFHIVAAEATYCENLHKNKDKDKTEDWSGYYIQISAKNVSSSEAYIHQLFCDPVFENESIGATRSFNFKTEVSPRKEAKSDVRYFYKSEKKANLAYLAFNPMFNPCLQPKNVWFQKPISDSYGAPLRAQIDPRLKFDRKNIATILTL